MQSNFLCERHQENISLICVNLKCESSYRLLCCECISEHSTSCDNKLILSINKIKNKKMWQQLPDFIQVEKRDLAKGEEKKLELTKSSILDTIQEVNQVLASYKNQIFSVLESQQYSEELDQTINLEKIHGILESQDIDTSSKQKSIKEIFILIENMQNMDKTTLKKSSDIAQYERQVEVFKNQCQKFVKQIKDISKSANETQFIFQQFNMSQGLEKYIINPEKTKIATQNQLSEDLLSCIFCAPYLSGNKESTITLRINQKGSNGVYVGIAQTNKHINEKFANIAEVLRKKNFYIYQNGSKGSCYYVDNERESKQINLGIQFEKNDVISMTYQPFDQALIFANLTKNTFNKVFNVFDIYKTDDSYSFFITSYGAGHEIEII